MLERFFSNGWTWRDSNPQEAKLWRVPQHAALPIELQVRDIVISLAYPICYLLSYSQGKK